MNPSDSNSEEKTSLSTLTAFEYLPSLPLPLFQSQCVSHNDEILICGGYYERDCYSYHVIKKQYKRICSYPDDVKLFDYVIVKLENKEANDDSITLLSFSGKPKHTLVMKYVSVWKKEEKEEEKGCNEWVIFTDGTNKPCHIARDKSSYEGARAVIGGKKRNLLFISYPPKNLDVFDLDMCKYVSYSTLPTDDGWIWYHCFVLRNPTRNNMLLFYKKTGLSIVYSEENNDFTFDSLHICEDISSLKRYAYLCVNDIILCFGGRSNRSVSKQICKYSILEDKWTKLQYMLPMPLCDCNAIFDKRSNCVHIIGGKDNKKDNLAVNMKTALKMWKRHPNEEDWFKVNLEAMKICSEMIQYDDPGLVIAANNISGWQNATKGYTLTSYHVLINNDKSDEQYRICVIKGKAITLRDVRINGNIYIIDCKFECEGEVNITTHCFGTNRGTVYKFSQPVIPIAWDSNLEHIVPGWPRWFFFDTIIENSLQHFKKCVDTYGYDHPFIPFAYSSLGLAYEENQQYDYSIQAHEQGLQAAVEVFGMNHPWTAQILSDIGSVHSRMKDYNEAISYYTKAFNIRQQIFDNADVYNEIYLCHLGETYEVLGDKRVALQYFEEAWKSSSARRGEQHEITSKIKNKVRDLS
ncbi:tetratricopeptide TPR_2 [Reticulomyxa filosa]|uniref:Tetratricopeptide TPR_2 n=1 Tax=Reticulomyxa filosa TaxID=46433 RepID=X6NB99_RETFI|nr:tetratricopeptide TPR_2 [Reticulomyxa filosa]|eukprot:ETO23286.1 tetratricopeptide TPR_2 [Reticulomyxa filosa]